MNMEAFNRLLLESIGVGLAVVDAETHEVMFFNSLFGQWFPLPEDGSRQISDVVSAISSDKLRENDGRFSGEVELKVKRRTLTIAINVSLNQTEGGAEDGDNSALLVECTNVSKVKELEYMIESYSELVEKNERQLRREKERAENLLLNVMPKAVYEELKDYGVTTPTRYDQVSILMLDFVGFTEMTISSDPNVLVSELNDIFTSFDRIVEQFGCERIKTIGDAYMAVSGLPEANPDHAQNIARAALLFRRYIRERNRSSQVSWQCRIGLATGPVIGSMIGVQKYVYDIFGPGVNLASRMESLSEPMEITLCETTAELIGDDFRLDEAPEADVKGFGRQKLFKLSRDAERPARRDLPNYLH
jgi:adenylate cyclase